MNWSLSEKLILAEVVFFIFLFNDFFFFCAYDPG